MPAICRTLTNPTHSTTHWCAICNARKTRVDQNASTRATAIAGRANFQLFNPGTTHMNDQIKIEQDGRLLRITLNRPQDNGISDGMAAALVEAVNNAHTTSDAV